MIFNGRLKVSLQFKWFFKKGILEETQVPIYRHSLKYITINIFIFYFLSCLNSTFVYLSINEILKVYLNNGFSEASIISQREIKKSA